MADETIPEEIVVPLQAEVIDVSKRQVATARVSVSVQTKEAMTTVSENLNHYTVEVERTPVGIMTDTMPEPREEEGDLIIPVVKEVLVRRYMVVEEVRLRRKHRVERHSEEVTLRHQEVVVSRTPVDPNAALDASPINLKLKESNHDY